MMNRDAYTGAMFLERFMTKDWAARFGRVCAALVLAIGCSEAAYWVWLGLGGHNFLPFFCEMKFNTSVSLVLCGTALVILRWSGLLPRVVRCGCAMVIMVVGVWTLFEFTNLAPFLIDQWLVTDPTMVPPFAGRMAPNTAAAFVIAGVFFVYTDFFEARSGHVMQTLIWLVVALVGVQLIAYLYGAKSLYAISQAAPMAPLTCLAFILFSIGAFMHFPGNGLVAMCTDQGLTGRMMRLMLPMALLIPVLMEWLEIHGEDAGWFSSKLGSAMMAVATAGLLVVVVFRNAKFLRQLDTERGEALQRVALSEGRLQAILNGIPVVVYIKDRKGRYILTNRHYEDLFNVRYQDIVGKTDQDLFPAEQARAFIQNDATVLERGCAMEFEEPVTHVDGTIHHYLSYKFPIQDPMTTADVVCGVSFDISQRKEAEDKLRELGKFKSELASIVSHELRSPLALIRGEVELVDEGLVGPVTPDQKHHLGIALHSIDRLSRLITDVLDFQKLDAGHMETRAEPTDVVAVVNDTVESFKAVAAKKGVALRLGIPPALPMAMCDKDAMVEVLTNLIDNAIKYTDSGHIEVRVQNKGDHVEFEVEDSGIGIPQEEQGKLFQAFSRISTKGRQTEGTGLGLAICKRIVENNGGVIGVTSQVGNGATFFFTVPVAKTTQGGQRYEISSQRVVV